MIRMMQWVCVSVLAITLAGCASSGGSATPCEQCDYGYVPVKKMTERRVWCIVDGKKVDCTKNPAECPECAKKMQEKK